MYCLIWIVKNKISLTPVEVYETSVCSEVGKPQDGFLKICRISAGEEGRLTHGFVQRFAVERSNLFYILGFGVCLES